MGKWTLKRFIQSIFLDFTIDGERVITKREYGVTEDGKKYISKRLRIIKETEEVLEERVYGPNSKRPIYNHITRPYMLN